MPKIYQLSTCNTCQRILGELPERKDLEIVNIKTEPLTEHQVDELAQLAGSYEALFSRHARKYRSRGLNKQELSEADYKRLLLEEYTFLKRPVIVVDDQIFIGNRPKAVDGAKAALAK